MQLNKNATYQYIIYQADIFHENKTESYIGCSETEFKPRYYHHIKTFKTIKKRNSTELSKIL